MVLKNWLRPLRNHKAKDLRGRRPRPAKGGRIRPAVEHLEDRVTPATLTINNSLGTLVYQAGAGVNNNFSLTNTATTYTFQDSAEPITLAGDTAGWSVSPFGAGSSATGPSAGYTAITVNTLDGNDVINVTPSPGAAVTVNGGPPTTAPGDTLNVNTAGATNPVLTVTSGPSGLSGSYTFGNRQPVNFQEIESLSPTVTDLAITKTDNATTAVPGTLITYTIVVTNNGPLGVGNATVTDSFPSGLNGFLFDSYTSTATGGATGNTASGSGDIGDTVSLPAGSTITYVVTAFINPPATGNLTNTATVTTGPGVADSNTSNNIASDTDTLTPQADLGVTKTGPSTVTAGTDLATYTLTVVNNGPSDAQGATLTDAVPAGTTFVSLVQTFGPLFSTAQPNPGDSGTVSAFLTSMPSGTLATFEMVVHANPSDPNGSTITNTASVGSNTPDPNGSNDSATVTTTVNTSADLVMTKTGTATADAGTNVTYTLAVSNAGPSDAQNVSVSDTLPAGETFISASVGTGAGTGYNSGSLGALAAGGTLTITLVAHISPSQPAGTLTDTATVSSSTSDPNATNSTATFGTTVTTSADLAVTKTSSAGAGTVTAGTLVTYTVTLTNAGPSDAQGVVLTDTLSANETFQSSTDSGSGTFTPSTTGNTTTFTASGPFAVGGVHTFTITARVNSSTANGSTASNTATVTSPTDTNAGNNTATVNNTVATSADLVMTKSGPATATAGTQVTYTLSVSNSGPSDAQGVTVTDTLPAGTAFVSASEGSGSGTSYTDPVGTLAAGATRTITVVALASPSVGSGTGLTDTATVSGTTADPNAGNNTGTATTVVQTSADLAVTKSGPATVNAGQQITYTVTVADNGPSDATSVQFTDTVPANTTFVSASSTQGTVTQTGGVISGNLGTVTTTAPVTVTIVVSTAPSLASGTVITNAATATPVTADPNTGNNTGTATTAVNTSADLSLVKTGTATAAAGTQVTYTLTVSNSGPSDAQGVTVTDTLPAGTTFVSASVGSGSGTGYSSGNLGTLAAGGTLTITLVARISPSQPAGTLTDTATVSSPTDPNAGNNTATFGTTVATSADLVMTKSGPATATAGTQVTYTLSVSNAGPSDAQAVTVTDTLPAGETFVSASVGSGSGTTYSSGNLGTLAAGASTTITVVALVSPSVGSGTGLTDTATVSSSTSDPNAGNNTGTATTVVQTSADLAVTKSGPATGVAGTNVTYTVVVSNGGPSDAQAVTVTDTLPAGETFVSASTGTGAGTLYTSGNLGTLAAGASTTITLVAHISPSAPDGSTLTDTATAGSSTADPNSTNNTGTASTTVATSADLSLVKTGPATANAGANVTYTLAVSNAGPSDAQAVTVTDTLPTGETFVSASVGTGAGTGYNSGSLGALAAGGTLTITLVARISPSQPAGTLTNSATAGSTTADPNGTNNTATFNTAVTTSADLSVTKSGPAAAAAGTDLTYTITVSNAGPSDSQGVLLTDTLPANETFVSLTTPAGFTSTTPPVGSGGTITAGDPTLAAGASGVFTLVVHLSAGAAANSTVTNTATVASTGGTPDPNGGNNASSTSLTVNTSADLAVTASGTPNPVTAGTNLTYTITVSNTGPSDAQAVTLTDTLPSGQAFVSASVSQGTFTQSGGVVTGNLGTLAAGGSATVVIALKVNSNTPSGSTITDTAAVTTATTDPNGGNNSATIPTSVTTSADLGITKTFSPNPPAGVANLTYTITVANAGPSDSQSTVVTDALPPGTVFQSVTVSQGTASNSGGTVTANLGALAAGASATVTVVVNVPPGTVNGTTLTNTASVSSTTPDPNPANNSVTVSGKVIAPSTVGVFDGQAQYGDPPATWKLRNSNQPGAPDITPFQYGSPTSTPVMGDWDGNGTSTVGVVDVVGGLLQWKLRNSNSPGAPDITFTFGVQGNIPVVGDWAHTGHTGIGVFDPATGTWKLRDSAGAGAPDFTFAYGMAGDTPVVGDWNGDGTTSIGVVRPNTSTGTLTWLLRNSNSAGGPDIPAFAYGSVGSTPVTGDWNADGVTTIGVYDPVFAGWKLRNSNTAGAPDIAPLAGFAYGSPGGRSLPVTGQYGPGGMPEQAMGGARPGSGGAPLSQADLQQTVTAALDRLGAAGVSANLLGRLAQAQFTVGTLTTGTVGAAFPSLNRVVMDATAAGHGWFVDPTPLQDEEFSLTPQGSLAALPGSAAQGREDLLTAVLHELGHIAGLADTGAAGTLMGGYLADGVRLTAALDRVFARGNF